MDANVVEDEGLGVGVEHEDEELCVGVEGRSVVPQRQGGSLVHTSLRKTGFESAHAWFDRRCAAFVVDAHVGVEMTCRHVGSYMHFAAGQYGRRCGHDGARFLLECGCGTTVIAASCASDVIRSCLSEF